MPEESLPERRRMADRRKDPQERKPERRRRKTDRRAPQEEIAPDVIITRRGTIRVLRRPGESREEYEERFRAVTPELTAEQESVIRAAAREYWQIVRERARRQRQLAAS